MRQTSFMCLNFPLGKQNVWKSVPNIFQHQKVFPTKKPGTKPTCLESRCVIAWSLTGRGHRFDGPKTRKLERPRKTRAFVCGLFHAMSESSEHMRALAFLCSWKVFLDGPKCPQSGSETIHGTTSGVSPKAWVKLYSLLRTRPGQPDGDDLHALTFGGTSWRS